MVQTYRLQTSVIVGTLIALENVPGTFLTFDVGMF